MLRDFLRFCFLFVAAGYKPEWNFERDSKEKAAVEETKEKEEPAAGPESQSRETVVRQQQEEQRVISGLHYCGILY